MTPLEEHLRKRRDNGSKLLVPYVTAGYDERWADIVGALALAGADAIEIGIPFSDPVMDGPVIQQASQQALARGTTPHTVLEEISAIDSPVPLLFMTYYNLVFRAGTENFAIATADAGVSGVIVPDLPLNESMEWRDDCRKRDLANVMLAAPTSSDTRLAELAEATDGFLYGVGVLGVTGERQSLAASASEMARRMKAVTDKPVLIGVGISSADQAREVCREADGVIVGSALMRRLLDGASAEDAGQFVGEIRTTLDGG